MQKAGSLRLKKRKEKETMNSLENYNFETKSPFARAAARVWAFFASAFQQITDDLAKAAPSLAEELQLIAPEEPEQKGQTSGSSGATVEGLFGDKLKAGEIKATVFSGNQPFEVSLSQNEAGALEIRKASSALIRRSKPNGVSATVASGSSGVTQVGTRVSQDSDSYGGGLEGFVVFARSSFWKNFVMSDNVSLADLRNVPLDKIGELLATVSPEVSQGLYIRTIFSCSGYEVKALQLEKDETDEKAQKVLDAIRAKVARQNGTEDVFYSRLFNTLFMRGSILAELVLEDNARDFAGIVTPDPKTLHFRRIPHPTLGRVWDFFQLQNGKSVSLNVETVRYIPLNPFTDSIEGNPLIPSSFFIAVFMMAVLRDFKRVIQQQGYPRYDLEINLEKLQNLMPSAAKDDTPEGEQAFQVWAEELRDTIKSYVSDLAPDETFIHFEGVKVNTPVGAMGTNSLTSIDGLFKGLERMAARALKVPPLFMGIIESVSEANANRQFEAFLKDIENGQHTIENAISDLYKLALEAQGIRARVQLRFAQIRSSERLRDAQAEMTEAELAAFQYKMGWISQDEAALRGAKVRESDEKQPRISLNASGSSASGGGTVPPALDNGVNKSVRVPTVGELAAAKKIFEEFAPDAAAGLIFAEEKEN